MPLPYSRMSDDHNDVVVKKEKTCVVPEIVFDSLADSDVHSETVAKVEAMLGRGMGFSYPVLCDRLCSLFVDVWQNYIINDAYRRLRPSADAPLRNVTLKDVHTGTIVPFGEPWSAQLDMSFETAPSGCVTCPDPHAFSKATYDAWTTMSASSSARFYAEWVLRCYTAFPHEITHVVQNAVHFHDSSLGGWKSEYGASVLSGPVLVAAVLHSCKDSKELFPHGFATLHSILSAWQFEVAHQQKLFDCTKNVNIVEVQNQWSSTKGVYIPEKIILDTPGAALFLKSSIGAASFEHFLQLAESGEVKKFEEELINLTEHCIITLSDKPVASS